MLTSCVAGGRRAQPPALGALLSSVLASAIAKSHTVGLESSWQVTQKPPRPEAPGIKDQAPRAWSEAEEAEGPRGRCPRTTSSRADISSSSNMSMPLH